MFLSKLGNALSEKKIRDKNGGTKWVRRLRVEDTKLWTISATLGGSLFVIHLFMMQRCTSLVKYAPSIHKIL